MALAIVRKIEVSTALSVHSHKFLLAQYQRHQIIDPSLPRGLTPGEYWAEGMTRAFEAHDPERSLHFAQELARVRARYPALWERAKQRLLYEVVVGDSSPGQTMEDLMARALERYLDETGSVEIDADLYAAAQSVAARKGGSVVDLIGVSLREKLNI